MFIDLIDKSGTDSSMSVLLNRTQRRYTIDNLSEISPESDSSTVENAVGEPPIQNGNDPSINLNDQR